MDSSELCPQCKMPEDRHTSDCLVRLERKAHVVDQVITDLTKWRTDPDVKLILNATMSRHGVQSLADLPRDVIEDLHDAIGVMLEESPTNTHLGDPRRMV